VFAEGGYSPGARVAFACAGVVAGGVAVAADRPRAARALRDPLAIVLAAIAALSALSALWTLGTEERTLRAAAVVAGWLGVFVAAAVAASARRGRLALAGGVAAIAAVSAAIGLAGAIAHDRPHAVEVAGDWRPAGPLEYPPALALLVVCALPAFVELARARPAAARAAGAAGIGLSAAVLVLAQSRVGLALGLGVAALFAYRVTRRPAAVVAGVAVALAAGALAFGPGDGPPSGFLHGREDTWRAAVDTFLDRPLHGAGADAFLAGSARHQDGAAIRFAHDLPLELAAELGVLGLLLALALYVSVGRLVWSARLTRAGWLFGPAALAFPLANLLDWPWHLAGMGAIWALGSGAMAGSEAYRANPPGIVPESEPKIQGDP
jgi:O-antigen ligase